MKFARSINADRMVDPASAEPWATRERRWPSWKDKISFRIFSSVATAGTTGPSGGLERPILSKAEGCFSFKTLSVSPSLGTKHSAGASSLTAPLTPPSTNFASTLLFWVSSHPRTTYLAHTSPREVGAVVLSINRATCCLTSVESKTDNALKEIKHNLTTRETEGD